MRRFTKEQKESARAMLRLARSRGGLDVDRQIQFARARTQAATKLSVEDTMALLKSVAREPLPEEPKSPELDPNAETRRMSDIYGG